MNIAALIIGGLAAIWAGCELIVKSPVFGFSLFFVAAIVGMTVAAFGFGAIYVGLRRIIDALRARIPEISQ